MIRTVTSASVFVPLLVATLATGCGVSVRLEHEAAARAAVIPGHLIQDGVLVIRGQDTALVSIAVEETPNGLVVREIATRSTFAPADTINAAGLYVHSAHAFDPFEPRVGSPPLYSIRTGVSPSSPAVLVLSRNGPPVWRSVALEDNHPPGPVDDAAGCYEVVRGPWRETIPVAQWRGPPVPDDLGLHWQFKWHYGREHFLVATDAYGGVPGDGTHIYTWSRARDGETVRIRFMAWYADSVEFQVTPRPDGFVGTVRLVAHLADVASADVRLRPIACAS